MRILNQVPLLFWKNVLLRKRSPGILVLELLWPVLVVGIISIMRLGAQPIKRGNCHYPTRAMPSAGAVQFLQTYVCNLNNKCYRSEQHSQMSESFMQPFSDLTQNLGPILASEQVLDVLAVSNQSVQVLDTMKRIVGDKELLEDMDTLLNISSYFKDPDRVKQILVSDKKLLTRDEADALVDAELNVEQLLSLTGTPDFQAIACDPNQLGKYVKFSSNANLTAISNSLCNMDELQIEDFTNLLIRELNISTLINAMSTIESVKEKFDDGSGLKFAMEAVAEMFEVVMRSDPLLRTVGQFAAIPNIADLIRQIPSFVEQFDDFNSIIKVLKEIVDALKPVMKSLDVEQSPYWLIVKDAALLTDHFSQLIEGKWNRTSEELIRPLNNIVKNLETLSEDGNKLFMALLDFISNNNWANVYDDIIHTRTLSEGTINQMAKSLQDILQQTDIWPSFQKALRVSYHALDVFSILTEKSIELRRSLTKLFYNKGFVTALNQIFQYGLSVSNAFLDTLRNRNVIGDIMRSATNYQYVCERIVQEMKGKVPDDIHSDINDVLCSENKEFARVMNDVTEKLNLSEIADIVNKTIHDFEKLYEGEFFTDSVKLADFFPHYNRFTTAINAYIYDDFNWMAVFDGISRNIEQIETNERNWEPFVDLLNGDYVSSLILGLYEGFGQALGASRISKDIGPGVHILSEIMQGIYGLLYHTEEMTSTKSELVQLIHLFTSYMPEMISGISYMWHKNMVDIYQVALSSDPLKTFCDNNYMNKMNLPAYVPVMEMNNLVCKTDWEAFIRRMESTANTMNSLVDKMENALQMSESSTYNVEQDWSNMVDYTSKLWDLIRMGNIAGVIDWTTSSVKFVNQLNFSRIEEAMDVLSGELDKMEMKDMEKMFELGFKLLENMDRNAGGSQEWQEMRSYMVTAEAYMELQVDVMKQIQTTSSLSDMLKMYPKDIRTMTVLLAKAYPEFVRALANIFYDPEKFINHVLKQEFQTPDCQTHFVMDYTLLPPDSTAHELEKFICNLNFTEFLNQLMMAQPSANISQKLTDLLEGKPMNVEINWEGMIYNVKEMMQFFDSTMTTPGSDFDLTPFNVTAINLSWDEFYKAARTIEQMDPNKIEELTSRLETIFTQILSSMGGNDTGLLGAVYAENYINYISMKLLARELQYFNDSSEVIIFDYLGSDELKKLSSFLMKSPDINAIGVATLQRLLTSPGEAPITFDFEGLCANLSLFKAVFVTEVSPLDPAIIQNLICNELFSINLTVVIDDILANRPSIKEFIYDLSIFERKYTMDDIQISVGTIAKESAKLNQLIMDITAHPPEIKITANDRWTDMSLYAKEWEKLGEKLSGLGQDTGNLTINVEESVVKAVLGTLKIIPGTSEIFNIISAIIDIMQSQIDQTNGKFIETISQYPNAKKIIDLLQSAPEAIQTVFYTILTQPDKTAVWANALQSWDGFCKFPKEKIFTVPSGIQFSMVDFLSKACTIDIEELAKEMASYQNVEALMNLSNDTSVNSSVVEQKMLKLVTSFSNIITSEGDMSELNLRILNETIWNEIGERIGQWSNEMGNSFMVNETDNVLDIVIQVMKETRNNLPPEVMEVFDRAVAVTDIAVTEMMTILNATSLEKAFKEFPNIKQFVYLLDRVPELFESLLYTSINHAAQVSSKLSGISSIEEFCMNKPEEILTPAPNTNFNVAEWMKTLCSLNMTQFTEDLMQYRVTLQVQKSVEQNITQTPDLSALIKKVEHLMEKVQRDIKLRDREFSPDVWDVVLKNISSWIWPYKNVEGFIAQQQQNLAVGILTYLENMPGTEDALRYLDAILDLIGKRTTVAKESFSQTFDGFPTLKTIAKLLEEAPEMIETALYTVMTQPDKTTAWSSALMSFSQFCATPATDIMKEPPGSKFNVAIYLAKLCSIDIDTMVKELTHYQGIERLNQLENGNSTEIVNVTIVTKKLQGLLSSLEDYYTNPLETMNFNLRLFNETVWQTIGQRIEMWSNSSMSNYGSEQYIADIIRQFFGSMKDSSPELYDAYQRALKITTVVANQVLDVMEEGSLQKAFRDIPSLNKLFSLAESIPELFEVLVYTSVNNPEKVTKRADALTSLEKFCTSQPETMFTLPPSSSFDLKSWLTQFCSLNMSEIETQLMNFKTARDIENIISNSSNIEANLTAVVLKIDNLMKQFSQGKLPSDRFFNESVWSRVTSRISAWISDEDFLMQIPSLSGGSIYLLMDQLSESDPAVKEMFRPVAAMMVVLDNLMTNVLRLEGKTHFGTKEVFENWKNMQATFTFIQLPGVLEVLIASASSDSFSSLFSEQGLADFCSPARDPSKYLKAPKHSNIDLSQIKSEFCKVDFENFISDLDSFINIATIEQVANGSIEYDWSGFEDKVRRMQNLIDQWVKHPPTFDVPSYWNNESYWQNLLDSQILPLEESLTTREQVMNIISQMGPILEMEGFKQAGIVLNSVLDILNENIKAIQGSHYTVENMVNKIPALRELFDAFGLDSASIRSIMLAPVKNTTRFVEILTSEDIKRDFCQSNQWHQVIDFPANFDTSGLYSAFCKDDTDVLLKKLQSNFNLETMLTALDDGKHHIQDWKNASMKVFELIENFEQLLKTPPNFDASKTLALLTDNYNLTSLMELASAFSVLQQTFLNESEVFQPLSKAFNIAQVVIHFLDDTMARIKLQNGRLDLASLFKDVPEFQSLIKSVLDITPDPLTGLFSIQLNPEKVDHFISMAANSTQLMHLFCSKDKFEEIFTIDPSVNLTSVLKVLCGFDFESVSLKLSKAFKVNFLTNEISRAMNSNYAFDEDKFTESVTMLISYIMNLTSSKQVTFQGHDLADIFNLNASFLLKELENQGNSLGGAFTGDYAEISIQIVSSVLQGLKGFMNIEEVVSALRFIQVYLHSFNSFLKSVKDQPISLALLLNNTEVGHIINPILTNPHSLDGLRDTTVNIEKLGELLSRASPEDALCSNELWSTVNASDDKTMQTLHNLQTSICSLNQSQLLWQTVMLQANGFRLYQQVDFINKDLQHGKSSVDMQQVRKEMNEFISLMNTLITQYVNGSRSFENLVDLKGFKALLDTLQSKLADRLMEAAKSWSVDTAEILLPKVLDQNLYQGMAKTLNTINLFMDVTIGQLQRIKDGKISASTLFNNADTLINLMEAYIKAGKNIAKVWSDKELDIDKITKLFNDMDQLKALCAQPDGISKEISNSANPSQTAKDMSTVICSIVGSSAMDEFKKFVDYDHIEKTLMAIWNPIAVVTPDYDAFVNNVDRFTSLIEHLTKTSFTISSQLTGLFSFDSFFDDIANIAESPEMIFRLLKLLGIAIESPLKSEPEVVKVMSQANSFVLMPLVHILEALKAKGVTLVNMADNPDALLNIISVAVDFNVHFKVIQEIVIKPQIRTLKKYQNQYCGGRDYYDQVTRRLAYIKFPLTADEVFEVICNSSSTEWLVKFEEKGLTNIQITVLLDQLSNSDLTEMPDENFGWVQLMSSLEQLSSLITASTDKNKGDMNSVKTAWDHVKDILFDKTFKSLLSYLQLLEGSQPNDEGWMEFKQFLSFFSSVMKFVDTNLKNINGTVHLKNVLPDSLQVSMLLNDLLGQQNAAEFLAMSVNPEGLFKIGMSDTWDEVCNDPSSSRFTTYFQFPPGTHVEALKKSICQATLAQRTNFQQLLSLFSAGDMLKQLDMLIKGQYNSSYYQVTMWDTTHKVMMHLIGTLEKLQHAMIDGSSVEEYFKPILDTLSSLSNSQSSQLVNMCNAVVMYLNETSGYMEARNMISIAITTTNMVTDMVRLLPDLDETICALGTKEKVDLASLIRKLTDLGIMDIIEKAASEYISPPNSLQCSAPLRSSEVIMNVLNATMTTNEIDVSKIKGCFKNIESGIQDILSSVTNAAAFVRSIGTALQTPRLAKFFENTEWMPLIDFVIDTVDSARDNKLMFEDLFTNKANVSQYLTGVLGLTDEMVASFMNATVNKNWTGILQQSADQITDMLCDPAHLSKVISLPEKAKSNLTDISQQLCSANGVTNVLKSNSLSLDEISKLSTPDQNVLKVVNQMADDVSKIFVNFKDIIEFVIDLLTNFSFEIINKDVDLIDKIVKNDELSQLGNRIKSLIKGLKQLVGDQSEIQQVLSDIDKVVEGLMSIDFIKNAALRSLKVEDLVADPSKLKSFMQNELGMSEQTVNDILNAAFSFKVILGLEEKSNHTCEDIISMLIILNDTRTTKQDLKNAFCSLSPKQLEDLFNDLKMQFSIGDLVSQYVKFTADSVLKATNLTKEELNDVVATIDRGQYFLTQATETIYDNVNGSDILNIFSQGSAEAFTGMNELTPLICGEAMADVFSTDFTPGAIISTKDDLTEEIKEGIKDNVDDLPNEFCVEIYEEIRKSSIGGILWAYIKPIMRGKILYTPVNDVTQKLVQQANKTFEILAEVERVANIWATGTSDLNTMMQAANDTEDLRNALENDFIKGILKSTIDVSPESIISGLDALQANNFGSKELKALQTAAKLIANVTSCLEFDRYEGVESEEELETRAYQLTRRKIFFAGIVFLNTENMPNSNATSSGRRKRATPDIPKHVSYKIRMDVDNVMDTNQLKSPIWKMTAEDSFVEDLRYMRGFIFLQDMLDSAIIEIHKDPSYSIPGARLKQMPFPCHHIDNFIFVLGTYLVPVMMTFVFLASIGVATYNLVYDRESGQEQALQVMGMKTSLNFIVWLLSTMALMAVVSFVMAVMLKYTDIFIYSNFFLLFLYILAFCFSSVMLLYMVSAFFNRTTMAILFVLMIYLISYMPYILIISLEVTMKFWHKIVACLASTTAFSFGAHNLAKLEETGQGLQWSNIQSEAAEDFSMHWACIMMLIDSGIYFLIGWYVRHVKPGKFGIAQPWYFPLSLNFWCCNISFSGKERLAPQSGDLFEGPPENLPVGITIENLSKFYGKKQAVKDMNLNIYKGQITCLLGHNGAAKTTTLKMLYGLLEPSSGRIRINGKKPINCKNVLGICPQQNALFDYMNVFEHMKFYAGVKKGSTDKKTLQEIKKLLTDVDLWHDRQIPARDLSYGMKRRLCVALAFVAGSDTVILDEPTSGIDPHARRNIWNLITSNKEGRTIILSTHHLDEADIIGDRIAIMHTGKLLCCGSPAFLKKSMGGGFKLSIMKMDEATHTDSQADSHEAAQQQSTNDVILKFIKNMCAKATITGQRGNDLWIKLPKDESMMSVPYHLFFKELDNKSPELGIVGYGLSDTTLEEIFLKLTDQADEENDKGIINASIQEDGDSIEQQDLETGLPQSSLPSTVDTKVRKQGFSLKAQQFGALLKKRCIHYRRNWRMLLTCIFLPLLSFLLAMGFSEIRPDEGYSKSLLMDPRIYGADTYTFFKMTKEAKKYFKADNMTDQFRHSKIGIGTTCMADYDSHETGLHVNCRSRSDPYKVTNPFYLPRCEDARQTYYPLGNLNSTVEETATPNGLLQQNLDEQNIPYYLMRTFKDYKDQRFGGWSVENHPESGAGQVDPYVWFNSKGYHAMPSFLNSLSNFLLRTYLPLGENPDEYGITAINHPVRLGRTALTMKSVQNDAADAGIAIVIVIAFSFIPSGFMLYLIGERTQKEKQLQHISGVGLFMYWLSTFLWDMILFVIAIGISVGIVSIFQTDSFYIRENLSAFTVILLLYGWAIIPFQYFLTHFFSKGSTAFLFAFCLNLFLALVTIISLLVLQLFRDDNAAWEAYKECRYLFLIFPQYALGQGLMEMVANTVKYNILLRFDEDFYESPYSLDILGWHLVALAAFGFFFFIVNLIVESKRSSALSLPEDRRSKHKVLDEDVQREKDRILHASNNDVLVVDDLSKVYRRRWKKFCAVDRISFGVSEGQSFGLLGVNGAGKTTTFRMLTGDLTSSSGTATLNGAKLSSMSHQLRQGVGYCPQEGGLDEYLTAKETLHFHAKLKGLNDEQTEVLTEELLTQLHLKAYANTTVHKYSGGTKRKLALAIAMLGNPPILYLDEPTTGMDPATRRLAWKCIVKANSNGQSVVLTSHMMDECDALCSKIAIMVNGEIKCIGSPQHLKRRFGDGYTVIIQGHNELINGVAHSFLNQFPGSVIQSQHFTSIQMMIPHNSGNVADILEFLQNAQKQGLVEYHSLSQTTLDSVFISFAQDQSDHFYDSSSSYTPSGSQEETPSGSISSSNKPPSYSSGYESKVDKGKPIMSPQFVNPAYMSDENESQPRYVSNITIGHNANSDVEYHNAPQSEPRYVSNVSVRNKPDPIYDNFDFNTKL